MLFSSPPFFIFFACYFALHLMLPRRLRLPLILVGSTIFYGYWNIAFVGFPYLLMLIGISGTWWLDQAEDAPARRLRLFITVALLLAPLGFFKYINFFYADVWGAFFPTSGKLVNVILPLGISFITFTLIGYAVDVYRRSVPYEKNWSLVAGSVMFFPHLIAGPVVLPRQLISQLANPRSILRSHVTGAMLIFAVGMVKKLVFADQMANVVNPVFNEDRGWSCFEYLLAIYGFSLQIYCDFSGYSDMAIGVAMLLGVKLPLNFERPYVSGSIVEFWTRWHITLSNWLKNYLYIPLGGNRGGLAMQMRNVFITMALGGLWHGARWTFVIWGVAHGAVIALTHLWKWWTGRKEITTSMRWLSVLLTFHFVTLAWILFRATSLDEAWRVLSGAFTGSSGDLASFASQYAFPLVLLGTFFLTHRFDNLLKMRVFARKLPGELMWLIIAALLAMAVAISAGNSAEFIYFDF